LFVKEPYNTFSIRFNLKQKIQRLQDSFRLLDKRTHGFFRNCMIHLSFKYSIEDVGCCKTIDNAKLS